MGQPVIPECLGESLVHLDEQKGDSDGQGHEPQRYGVHVTPPLG